MHLTVRSKTTHTSKDVNVYGGVKLTLCTKKHPGSLCHVRGAFPFFPGIRISFSVWVTRPRQLCLFALPV